MAMENRLFIGAFLLQPQVRVDFQLRRLITGGQGISDPLQSRYILMFLGEFHLFPPGDWLSPLRCSG